MSRMVWQEICNLTSQLHETDGHDWLYHTSTSRCGCGGSRDNDPSTAFSLAFFPTLYVLGAIAIATVSRKRVPKKGVRTEKEVSMTDVRNPVDETNTDVEAVGYDAAQIQPSSSTFDALAENRCGAGKSPAEFSEETVYSQPRLLGRGKELAACGKQAARQTSRKERLWYIDYCRILCVACVVTEHSGGSIYSDRNIAWVQQWVLPYLYTISGMSFMFSSGNVWAYLLRLLIVFLVGTFANFLADVISGRDWQHDFANTIFQMMYVVVVGVLSLLLAPLRDALRWRSKNPSARASLRLVAWTLFWGAFTMICVMVTSSGWTFAVWFGTDLSGTGATSFLLYGPYVLSTYAGIFCLCFLACTCGSSGWAAWIIVCLIYITRVAIPYYRGGHPLSADLFAFGMLVQKLPLQGTVTVARLAREYWAIVFIVLLILSMPGVTGRCDLHPHYYVWERMRFYSIELILIVLLISGAFNTCDSRNITGWLNIWALYAYCFHVCWARIFFQPFYGALFTYAAVPVFYGIHKFVESRSARNDSRCTS